jgi:hypothetical protein
LYYSQDEFATLLLCKFSILRSFNINDNIVEHTPCLRRLVDWRYSLISQPATLFIEVLEDAEVVLLSKKTTTSYTKIPKLERF